MAEQGRRRKLVAILSADVVGYSRLMRDDEAATVETLQRYRAAIGRVIDRHDGRIVNAPGDNILAEFPSAVSTAGGLVFVAQHEGKLCAFDDETLDELWCFAMNTLTDAPAISFAFDGKQYIAVSTGGFGLIPIYFAPGTPGLEKVRTANLLWVFSL